MKHCLLQRNGLPALHICLKLIVFDSHAPQGQLVDTYGPLAYSLSDTVSNWGVFLDSSFKLDKQVSSVVQSSFYLLCQISKAKPYISCKDIHAFVNFRLDYCNSLNLGLQSALLHRLQLVQNAATHLLTGTKGYRSLRLLLTYIGSPFNIVLILKCYCLLFKS